MATTMQEYLEEVARRQATGWTPGVPTMPRVSTTWNLPSTARTTMRQAVPKTNLGDISAQSNPQSTTKRRGRPRTTPEKLQSISDRAGTGTIKPMLGAISKIAGPAGIAAELLRSEPAVASELAPGTIPGDFRVTQAYPSMAVEEGYPNVSTLPSFDVTPDAGGAVGGPPGGADKYGPSGYEGERIPPEGFRQIAPATVIAASDFEVGPTSMAQVGGIPSGRTFGVPTSTGLYSEAGVPMSNENLSWFGAAPVPTSPSMKDANYSEALKSTNDLSKEIQQRYQNYRDSYGQPVEHTDPYSSFPDWSWGEVVAPLAGINPAHFDRMRVLDKLSSTGALDVPSKHTMDTYTHALKSSDLVSSGGNKALAFALGIPGLFTASIPQTVGHYAGLYGETMPDLGAVIDEAVEKNVLNP